MTHDFENAIKALADAEKELKDATAALEKALARKDEAETASLIANERVAWMVSVMVEGAKE